MRKYDRIVNLTTYQSRYTEKPVKDFSVMDDAACGKFKTLIHDLLFTESGERRSISDIHVSENYPRDVQDFITNVFFKEFPLIPNSPDDSTALAEMTSKYVGKAAYREVLTNQLTAYRDAQQAEIDKLQTPNPE